MAPTPFNSTPKILRYLHYISRQRPLSNHHDGLPNLFRLARTKNNPVSTLHCRMMRQPANCDFNRRQIVRLYSCIERVHRGSQILCTEELLRKLAQRVIVSEAGACVIVVDELAGQEARCERPDWVDVSCEHESFAAALERSWLDEREGEVSPT